MWIFFSFHFRLGIGTHIIVVVVDFGVCAWGRKLNAQKFFFLSYAHGPPPPPRALPPRAPRARGMFHGAHTRSSPQYSTRNAYVRFSSLHFYTQKKNLCSFVDRYADTMWWSAESLLLPPPPPQCAPNGRCTVVLIIFFNFFTACESCIKCRCESWARGRRAATRTPTIGGEEGSRKKIPMGHFYSLSLGWRRGGHRCTVARPVCSQYGRAPCVPKRKNTRWWCAYSGLSAAHHRCVTPVAPNCGRRRRHRRQTRVKVLCTSVYYVLCRQRENMALSYL